MYIWETINYMFSKACEYGIRAALYIAQRSLHQERVSLKDIAREIDSPEAFTAKILQKLARNHLIHSVKGPIGGFEIQKPMLEKITLSDIITTLDGDDMFKECGLGLKECNASRPCPVHHQFVAIRSELRQLVENTRLYELATSLELELTYLK